MTAKEKWKAVKKAFEEATGKKKPSADLNSFFRKSPGFEPLLERIDKAKSKEDVKAACGELGRKITSYIDVLGAHQTDPSNKVSYKAEIVKMINGLREVETLANEKLNSLNK